MGSAKNLKPLWPRLRSGVLINGMVSTDESINPRTPPIGIVIPTYNRKDHLLESLRHLERQSWKDFEVLVIDDGSTDGTAEAVASYQQNAPFPLRYLHQANLGPATGRNRAISQMRAPICILIGDDIFVSPEFVRIHLDLHRTNPETEAVALGLTRWSERGQKVTRFMRWVGWYGVQFDYAGLMAGEPPDWRHFYTSNLSFKTEYLTRNRFHEGFPRAAMEDIELGYRLAARHGLRMHFLPDAVADHLHPTTFEATCRRMQDAGEGAYVFGELWPEHRRDAPRHLAKRALLRILTEQRIVMPLLTRVASLSSALVCPNPLMRKVLSLHARIGYNRAAAMAKPVTTSQAQSEPSIPL